MSKVVELRGVDKVYGLPGAELCVLSHVDLELQAGEFVGIVGASGSGKTTLMNILGCLDRPTRGTYRLDGVDVSGLSDDELSLARNRSIGFVFQSFNLIPQLTVLENVEVPLFYGRIPRGRRAEVCRELLDAVGLSRRTTHYPTQLSGGECQRVAIARALVNRPALLLTDEPTGNLDSHNGEEVLKLFRQLNARGHTIIMVTHNPEIAASLPRVIELRDGQILGERIGAGLEGMFLERAEEMLRLGLKNLARNKLRSFLTMLGMIFGVASVIAMLSVGAGARHDILASIEELGIQNIIVNSLRPVEETRASEAEEGETSIDRYGLTFRDQDLVRETLSSVRDVLPVNLVKRHVWHGSSRVQSSVLGVLPEHLTMFGLEAAQGRVFNHVDAATEAKVCVVRRGLIRKLNTLADPIGMTVQIGGFPFEIIGVLDDEEFRSQTRKALAIDDRAQDVYVPYSTSMRTFGTLTYIESGGSADRSIVELDQLIVVARSAELVYPTARMLERLLDELHEKQDYEIVVPLELLEQRNKTQQVFDIVMVLIAAISLVVGGIGIANIMLATITERTKEIGVRRALGARQSDILLQFLTETAAIGAIGGLFGCLLGLAAIEALQRFSGWRALIDPAYFALSLAISCAVAVLSGIYPARRASRMDPITALRYE